MKNKKTKRKGCYQKRKIAVPLNNTSLSSKLSRNQNIFIKFSYKKFERIYGKSNAIKTYELYKTCLSLNYSLTQCSEIRIEAITPQIQWNDPPLNLRSQTSFS